jgi:hypothetical protein
LVVKSQSHRTADDFSSPAISPQLKSAHTKPLQKVFFITSANGNFKLINGNVLIGKRTDGKEIYGKRLMDPDDVLKNQFIKQLTHLHSYGKLPAAAYNIYIITR